MGYPVQNNAPQIFVQNRSFGIGAFRFDSMLSLFMVGVYEQKPDGWNQIGQTAITCDPTTVLQMVKDKGGIAPFMTWLVAKLNSLLAILFVSPTVVEGEPQTDEQAMEQIAARIGKLSLKYTNGIITLS